MAKKRIFINMHYMEIGGAEASLIGLLQALDPERVDVDLFINSHRGELMQFIPSWVNILPEIPSYSVIESPVSTALKKGQIGVVVGRLIAKMLFKRYQSRKKPSDNSAIFGYIGKYVTPFLPSLKKYGKYDLAISFLTPHNVVLDKVNADKKICWIHTDYSQIDIDSNLEQSVWDSFDYIASISEDVTTSFCKVFPTLKEKIIQIENILSPNFIKSRVETNEIPKEFLPYRKSTKLLTIGRFCYPKKLDEVPIICHKLIDMGLDIHWFIIGYGGDQHKVEQAIINEGMQDYVHLIGKRENPYPYINACDWYVQPSRYEGKSIVVREAQILCKPVIITNYPTAPSQVQNGMDGVIVPLEIDACAKVIYDTIKDNTVATKLTDYLSSQNYGNESEVGKIYNLLNL